MTLLLLQDVLRKRLRPVSKLKIDKPVKSPKKALQLITFKGKGLKPGVDLDDSVALLELMDDQ